MASPLRRSQAATRAIGTSSSLFTTSQSDTTTSRDDPLQPLRAMADRVGKEVEKFAERVDQWHMHGSDEEKAKYQATVRMVGKFKDIADSTVKELKKQSGAENKGELQKSMRRRIQDMADSGPYPEGDLGGSFQSTILSIESSAVPKSTRVHELRQWQAEAATWDLLQTIISHYHPEPGVDAAAEKRARLAKVGGAYRYSPNQEIWDRFVLEDDQAKEKELVLKWLERTASNSESDIESITEQLEAQSGKDTTTWTSGWLDTKTKIKHAKRMATTDRPLSASHSGLKSDDQTQTLITQLDPDAPGRQKRALEKSDDYYDRALWMITYEMLRRGVSWKEISDWCRERNEAWRGISIGAANVSHSGNGPNLAGPTVGYLFRRMCFYAAKGGRTQYESAVYGLLSGDAKAVEAVCRSWEDHLYARYNSLLLSRFDGYLLNNHPQKIPQTTVQKFTFQDAVADYGDWANSSSRVIHLLRQQKSTAAQATLPTKLVQSSLISRTTDELFVKVGGALSLLFRDDQRPRKLIVNPLDACREDASQQDNAQQRLDETEKYYQAFAADPHALRILVHVYIVFLRGLRHTGISKGGFDDFCVHNVISAYIEFLKITKRIQLIPLYAAQLGEGPAEELLAFVLPDIKNTKEQRQFIDLIKQYGMDSTGVVQTSYFLQADRLFGRDPANYVSTFDILQPTSEKDYLWPGKRVKNELSGFDIETNDEELIESLRWVAHLEDNVYESFQCLQSGLLRFLTHGRIGAAIKFASELSVERLSNIRTQSLCGYAFDFTVPGSEVQDEMQLMSARQSLADTGRMSLLSPQLPTAEEHADHVIALRDQSQTYNELSLIVRLIILFQEWREEEDNLIKQRNAGNAKPPLKKIKELFEAIESILFSLLENEPLLYLPNGPGTDAFHVKKIYIPELILAYISIVQASAWFTNRDLATKAMDIAPIVADQDRKWLQDAFMEAGRMTELVDTLAKVAKSMLKLGAKDGKTRSVGTKKRGNHGETLKIWDLGIRN